MCVPCRYQPGGQWVAANQRPPDVCSSGTAAITLIGTGQMDVLLKQQNYVSPSLVLSHPLAS